MRDICDWDQQEDIPYRIKEVFKWICPSVLSLTIKEWEESTFLINLPLHTVQVSVERSGGAISFDISSMSE
jgi:hypothetical protein